MALAADADAQTLHPPARLASGNPVLDLALGGGLPRGSLLVLQGEVGAGAPEFALAILRRAALEGGRAVFASLLRSPGRVRREAQELLRDRAEGIEAVAPAPGGAEAAAALAEGLGPRDALVVESASALAHAHGGRVEAPLRAFGEAAAGGGFTLLVLHAPGALPPVQEARLREACDGLLSFSWRDGGPTRRRVLVLQGLRGLAPALDGEEVPVFEVRLHQGVGFSLSHTRSVV